jgi:hypothetical protein
MVIPLTITLRRGKPGLFDAHVCDRLIAAPGSHYSTPPASCWPKGSLPIPWSKCAMPALTMSPSGPRSWRRALEGETRATAALVSYLGGLCD